MLTKIFNFIKCLFGFHDWEKDRFGFHPKTGHYFRCWNCKKCKRGMMKTYKTEHDEELKID